MMMSNHKLKNEKSLYIQAIEQLLININLNYFTYKIRLRYQKSILQSRSSFLPSYCILMEKDWEMDGLKELRTFKAKCRDGWMGWDGMGSISDHYDH